MTRRNLFQRCAAAFAGSVVARFMPMAEAKVQDESLLFIASDGLWCVRDGETTRVEGFLPPGSYRISPWYMSKVGDPNDWDYEA